MSESTPARAWRALFKAAGILAARRLQAGDQAGAGRLMGLAVLILAERIEPETAECVN